jgi:hypothetical protein
MCFDPLQHSTWQLYVPAYLKHFSKGKLLRDRWNNPLDSFIDDLLRDMTRFVEDCGGDPQAVSAAAGFIWPAREDGNGHALVDLLARFVQDGELKIVAHGSRSTRVASLHERDEGDTYFLPDAAVSRLLVGYATPPLPIDRVTAALRDAGALIKQLEDGCLFAADWLRKHRKLLAVQEAGLLTVVG